MIAKLEDEIIPVIVLEECVKFDNVHMLQRSMDFDLGNELGARVNFGGPVPQREATKTKLS